MCWYAFVVLRCRECGKEFSRTTLKRHDCLKRSCDKVISPGDVRATERLRTNPDCDCHFPLVTDSEEKRMSK